MTRDSQGYMNPPFIDKPVLLCYADGSRYFPSMDELYVVSANYCIARRASFAFEAAIFTFVLELEPFLIYETTAGGR